MNLSESIFKRKKYILFACISWYTHILQYKMINHCAAYFWKAMILSKCIIIKQNVPLLLNELDKLT